MKTLEEFYKEVQGNEELKKEFVASFKEGNVESFLKAHDCDATADDVMAFLNGTKDEAVTEDGKGCRRVWNKCDMWRMHHPPLLTPKVKSESV